MVAQIGREELKHKMDAGENFLLVEALPEEKYRQAHLAGALNLPHNQVRQKAASLLPDKNAEIVVYCAGPT